MKILIAEADEDHRLLLAAILEREQLAEVGSVADVGGIGAVPDADLLMIGTSLGVADVLAFCRRFTREEQTRDVPVIVVATEREAEHFRAAFEAGAMDYVRKPFDRGEVVARVRTALRLRAEIAARHEREVELAGALDRLAADLRAAAEVQRSLLPDPGGFPGTVDVATHFEPCAALGGDLFNVLKLPDGRLAFFMLDVAGHGVEAALSCVSLHRLLSASATGGVLIDAGGEVRAAGEVAGLLNDAFVERDDSSRYFTLLVGVLDSRTGEFECAGAGHPPALVAGGDGVRRLASGGPPIGLVPQVRYRAHRDKLGPGEVLLLYSDGILEARGAGGELFGIERLADAFSRRAGVQGRAAGGVVVAMPGVPPPPLPSLQDIASGLLDDARSWVGARLASDDVSLLLLRCR